MNRACFWLFVLLTLLPREARAFCQATTCAALPAAACTTDADGCASGGAPLAWPLDTSLTVACSPAQASRSSGCDELVSEALTAAVDSWQAVDCGGARPRISFTRQDDAADQGGRLLLVEVVSAGWPYGDAVVGRTNVEFGTTSGTLVGATIALNAQDFVLGTGTSADEIDVRAVLTHELGHALGLAHSAVDGATMQTEAEVGYVSELGTLHADDEAALCAVYPPAPAGLGGAGGQTPHSSGAGCSVARPGAPPSGSWPLLLLGVSLCWPEAARPRRSLRMKKARSPFGSPLPSWRRISSIPRLARGFDESVRLFALLVDSRNQFDSSNSASMTSSFLPASPEGASPPGAPGAPAGADS